MIDVQEDQRERQAVAAGAAPFTLEELEKLLVIGDRGQRVLGAQALQLNTRRLELGGTRFERALELGGLHRQPAPAAVRPNAEHRQRAYQRRYGRQPVLPRGRLPPGVRG